MQNNKGFSLIEVLVAVFLFGIMFLGLNYAYLAAVEHNARNAIRKEAINVVQSHIDNLRNSNYAALATGTSTEVRNVRGRNVSFSIADTVSTVAATKNVAITVSWSYKNNNYSRVFNTVIKSGGL